jgi:hypothetical protein
LVAARDAGEVTPEEFDEARRRILAHGPEDTVATDDRKVVTALSARRLRNRRRAVAVALVIVVGLVTWVIVGLVGLTPARLTLEVRSATPSGGDAVTLSLMWSNSGDEPGSGSCTLSAAVHDASGQLVGDVLDTVTTNSAVAGGGDQSANVEIMVGNGDAPFVTPADVSITGCQ